MTSLIAELKRRNVIKVALAYALVAWFMIEVTATTFPILKLPDWTVTLVTVLLIIGFPLALIFAWAFELTPEGIQLEKEADRPESVNRKPGRTLNRVIMLALRFAVAALLTDRFVLQYDEQAATNEQRSSEPPIESPRSPTPNGSRW